MPGRLWKPPNASDVQMLDSDVTRQSLKRWRRVWESFESQHNLEGYPKHQQYGMLMSRLTIALQRVIDVRCSVDLDDKNQTPTEILDSLADYLKSSQHEAKDNLAFYKRTQQHGESITDYYIAVDDMADQANLCKVCRDKTMSFQLLGGLRSDEIQQSVLALDPFPNLKGVLKKALNEELSRDDQTPFRVAGRGQVQKLERGRSRSPGRHNDKSTNTKKLCQNCGGQPHVDGQKCFATTRNCNKCGKKGHIAKVCRSGKVGQIQVCHLSCAEKTPLARVMINSTQTRDNYLDVLLDTGAELTVMGKMDAYEMCVFEDELTHTD